nr:substrate-binding domain-containing protein [Pseudenhygromyxa sp. WMMC2535]
MVIRTSQGTFVEPGAEALVRAARDFELEIGGLHRAGQIDGEVKISAGGGFAPALVEVLETLRRSHPKLRFELVIENRRAAIGQREADIGLRTVRSRSADVVERKLGELQLGLYGARALIERLGGAAAVADDLGRAPFVVQHEQAQLGGLGRLLAESKANVALSTNSPRVLQDAICLGVGLGVLPVAVGSSEPGLLRLPLPEALPALPCWTAVHRELREVPRIRATLDALADYFDAHVDADGA